VPSLVLFNVVLPLISAWRPCELDMEATLNVGS
jgi:hypothetical protein